MNFDKYLPIGTVVTLKGGTKRIMITGFCCKENNEASKVFDYCALLYPEGFIENHFMLFDHSQIEKIHYIGLNDDENKLFQNNLKNYMEQNQK